VSKSELYRSIPGMTDARRAELLLYDAQGCGALAVASIRLLQRGAEQVDAEGYSLTRLTLAAINMARAAASAALARERIIAKL